MEKKRCYGCMRMKTAASVCEYCGYDERMGNEPHQLAAGTILKEQYLVGKVLTEDFRTLTQEEQHKFLTTTRT